jgi:serine/threonine protein kinase
LKATALPASFLSVFHDAEPLEDDLTENESEGFETAVESFDPDLEDIPPPPDVPLPEIKKAETAPLPEYGLNMEMMPAPEYGLNVEITPTDEAQGPPELVMPERRGAVHGEFNLQKPNPYGLENEAPEPAPRAKPTINIDSGQRLSKNITEEMIKEQIRAANEGENLGLSEGKITTVAQAILAGGDRAIDEAQRTGKKTIIDTDVDGVQVMATKKGALSVRVGQLGEGFYKETHKFVQIFDRATKPLGILRNRNARKSTAVGQFKPTKDAGSLQEAKNEGEMHTLLSARRKSGLPLPNVAIGKKIRRMTAGNVSEEAISLKLYNGGSVDGLLDGHMSGRERASVCHDAMKGIAQLHEQGVVHRDIKSDNLLYEETEQLLPQEEWPQNLDPTNPPEAYSVEVGPDNQIVSVSKKERHVVVSDLGKASPIAKDKRFETGGRMALHGGISPPVLDRELVFTPSFDIYSAGRMAYQIFADVSIDQLPALPRISEAQIPEMREAIAKWTPQNAQREASLQDRKRELEDQIYNSVEGAPQEIMNEHAQVNNELKALDEMKKNVLIPQNWANWDKIPAKVQDFILRMVDLDQAKRPSAQECAAFFGNLSAADLA